MKIIHGVECTVEEVDSLFNPVMAACVASYPTVEEQAAALAGVKVKFEAELNLKLAEAFKLGMKLAKKKVDVKDTGMYVGGQGV